MLQGKAEWRDAKISKRMRAEENPLDSLITFSPVQWEMKAICKDNKREQEIDYEIKNSDYERKKRNDKLRNNHIQINIFHEYIGLCSLVNKSDIGMDG